MRWLPAARYLLALAESPSIAEQGRGCAVAADVLKLRADDGVGRVGVEAGRPVDEQPLMFGVVEEAVASRLASMVARMSQQIVVLGCDESLVAGML